MKSFEVQIGEEIFERRLQVGLPQTQVLEIVRQQGEPMTQASAVALFRNGCKFILKWLCPNQRG